MRNLPQKIVLALLLVVSAFPQSPHGDDFDYDCELCHEPTSWKIDVKKVQFDHSITKFELAGQHKAADCRSCHTNLEFSKINSDCISCHTDLHQGTVGKDCSKCHTSKSWMVEDINGLHQKGRFPLLGNHLTADCQQCHSRYVDLYFEPLNTDCFACHGSDFSIAHNPNDSKDCENCHSITASEWTALNVDHDFFPLVGGHQISNCFACHEQGGSFTGLSPECVSCHLDTYNATTNPNHISIGFPTDCIQCHTINGWSPATFDHDGPYFPIYTGKHAGEWNACADCHEVPGNYSVFTCISCHEHNQQDMDDEHQGVQGYIYESGACLTCHPTGEKGNAFNHANSIFPLTGAHVTTNCQDCHNSGYQGTPTECVACHQIHFNNSTNPNHTQLGLSTDCISCHTTNPDWQPALFPVHNQYYELLGKHLENANDCNSCHNGNYTSTPNLCYDCHTDAYNNSQNPNHIAAAFPTTCEDCHTTNGWTPATFDHDGLYFPIYTGEHAGEWNQCLDCHQVPNNYSVFTCISCHEHNQLEMDDKHQSVQGYIYESNACLSCHPDGSKGNAFNHGNSIFPLTGAHTTLDCQQCHQSGYSGTPTECIACHQTNYNNSTNPNHTQLGLSTECTTCHTTEPGWKPALFPIHNQYFELLGRHLEIANDCVSCHNGNYTTTSNLCFDCHTDPYNNAQNPNHIAAGIPHECEQCHNSTAWIPSTFNHTLAGFELLGAHLNIQCSNCHQGVITGLNSDCISCHQDDYNIAPEHVAQGYPTNCEMCHNSVAWNQVTFNHNLTNFPLTGAHISVNCSDCHESGFTGTTTICYDCHTADYQQSTNPSHTALTLPTDCAQCHTTNPDWQPATFPIHNQFFELLGAHANITNCADCHDGNYNNTPNTCIGCHQSEYNGTSDPPHSVLNFSFDCLTCHTMNGWTPANFNHSFYPISGHHNNVNCNQCHSEPNYQPQCLSCHMDDFLEEHDPGDPTNCWDCHDTFNWSIGAKVKGLKQIN
ncbi:MAG: hypothetical protein IH618_06655 [Ignavibacteriaceae bacterium]|nr:hypothetical protein [Ignavibacteriaceae bacterium]